MAVLSDAFGQFVRSEAAGGALLIVCTSVALVTANSPLGSGYTAFWSTHIGGLSVEHWVNDGLMAVFFLLIGLELERELYIGELSDFRAALLPIVAAAGGMLVPALIHYSLNAGTSFQSGIGIPVATDIAFALSILAMLGKRVPEALKIFVVAFAVMDDLGAVILIAVLYTAEISLAYLLAALAVWAILIGCNRLRVMNVAPYIAGGLLMWYFTLCSGVHATIAGVLLAFAIPFNAREHNAESPSHRLEEMLHKPVAFFILPVFALANTAVALPADWFYDLGSSNGLGIILGLVFGKPIGIVMLSVLAVAARWCRLPTGLNWLHLAGAGILGGIGFTMSIFIANLAFPNVLGAVDGAKVAILTASIISGLLGYIWFFITPRSWSR